MRYELYIDVYFLVNFLMDLVLLRLTAHILKRQAGAGRMLAAAAAGAAAACGTAAAGAVLPGILRGCSAAAVDRFLPGILRLCSAAAAGVFLPGILSFCQSAAAALVCCAAAFRPKTFRELLKEALLLFFLASATGGLAEFLLENMAAGYDAGLSVLTWVFLMGGALFLLRGLWICAAEVRRERSALCMVTLSVGEQKLKATAYRDSGNTLTEPESGLPVSIVSERLWQEVMHAAAKQGRELPICHIRYRTIGNPLGVMDATQIDFMTLYLETGADGPSFRCPASGVRPWIARAPFPLSGEENYEVLLHRDL